MAHEMKDNEMSSAAAFVEGGIQDACGDACSICLEEFSQTDPSTLTCCKHEFHLHCILEWCQRSSQCPMCWQSISLKDPTSQELLEAVERERKIRANPPPARRRPSGVVFRHSTLGDFRLPVGASDAELEQRIIQHLAAVAAIRSTHQRIHSSREGGGQSPFMVFSEANPQGLNRRNSGMEEEERGSLDLVRLSETLKSKWSMVSARYKESIVRSTRGWREKLFTRNSSMPMMMGECAVEGSSSSSRRREMNRSSSSLLCCVSRGGHQQQQQQQLESDGGYSAIRVSRNNHQTSNPENKPLIIGGEQGEAQGYV